MQVARELDINPKTLCSWIRLYKNDSRRTVQRSTSKEIADDKNRRIRAENKLLKQECDILKKQQHTL